MEICIWVDTGSGLLNPLAHVCLRQIDLFFLSETGPDSKIPQKVE